MVSLTTFLLWIPVFLSFVFVLYFFFWWNKLKLNKLKLKINWPRQINNRLRGLVEKYTFICWPLGDDPGRRFSLLVSPAILRTCRVLSEKSDTFSDARQLQDKFQAEKSLRPLFIAGLPMRNYTGLLQRKKVDYWGTALILSVIVCHMGLYAWKRHGNSGGSIFPDNDNNKDHYPVLSTIINTPTTTLSSLAL